MYLEPFCVTELRDTNFLAPLKFTRSGAFPPHRAVHIKCY